MHLSLAFPGVDPRDTPGETPGTCGEWCILDIFLGARGRDIVQQGGERLDGETSGSERKGVMQWTGSELKSGTKRKRYATKFGDLMELKEEFSIHALLLLIT